MKKIICLLVICFFISCKSSEKTNGFLEHDRTCRKYDTASNVTFVHNSFEPILKVAGKWRELSMNSKFYNRSPKIVCISNEENAILYLSQYKIPSCKICEQNRKNHPEGEGSILDHHYLTGNYLTSVLKRRIVFWRDFEKYTINLLDTDEENYALYSLSRPEEQKCVLLGIKNQIYYEFTLIESNLATKSKSKILSDSFKLN